MIVDPAREHALSRSGLADDEHGAVASCDRFSDFANLRDGLAGAEERIELDLFAFAGNFFFFMAGRRNFQIAFSSSCMSNASDVIAITAS